MARKKRNRELTEEELQKQIEERLKSDLRDLRTQYHINEPTVLWEVDQRVRHGAIDKTIVTEVLDGGKIIKVHETIIGTGRFEGQVSERDMYLSWHDVEQYWTEQDYEDIPILTEEDELRVQYGQRDMQGIFICYYHFGLDMSPDYQRGNVWTLKDKILLIDSIYRNVDIGKFTFIHREYKENEPTYEVLDGKQRITALVEFKERRFKYKGLTYDQLHWRDQGHFDHYPISWGEIGRGRKITDEVKYKYFLRLNTGGKEQDPEHIEHVRKLWEASKGGNNA